MTWFKNANRKECVYCGILFQRFTDSDLLRYRTPAKLITVKGIKKPVCIECLERLRKSGLTPTEYAFDQEIKGAEVPLYRRKETFKLISQESIFEGLRESCKDMAKVKTATLVRQDPSVNISKCEKQFYTRYLEIAAGVIVSDKRVDDAGHKHKAKVVDL